MRATCMCIDERQWVWPCANLGGWGCRGAAEGCWGGSAARYCVNLHVLNTHVGESADEDIAYLARGAPRRCVTTAPVWQITGADALWTGDVHYAGAREITESQSSTSTSRLRSTFWCALCSSYSSCTHLRIAVNRLLVALR